MSLLSHLSTTANTTCEITGTVGLAVQTSLAILIPIVLLSEFLFEKVRYNVCKKPRQGRTFRTFWLDSYKICTGALVSHLFNVGVSLFVNGSTSSSDECAVYALAFYYEACGVPFVQLLQYSFIQYSLQMSSSNANIIGTQCAQRWKLISQPGLYSDQNRYQISDCIHCRSCHLQYIKRLYWKIFFIAILTVTFAVLSGVISWLYYGTNEIYVEISVTLLVFIFLGTTIIAPTSALWQTLAWVGIKFTEKFIWSMFAISQSNLFAQWSNSMSTGNSTWDAWLFLAFVPIILNTFMFYMFSRISRLNLPCFTSDKMHNRMLTLHDNHRKLTLVLNPELVIEKNNNNYDQQLVTNDFSTDISSVSADIHSEEDTPSNVSEIIFDKYYAFKVGIIFMLIINMTLLAIAFAYLMYKGVGNSVWFLILSMIVVPFVCSIIAIQIFGCIINRSINICKCCLLCYCCRKDSNHKNYGGTYILRNNSLST